MDFPDSGSSSHLSDQSGVCLPLLLRQGLKAKEGATGSSGATTSATEQAATTTTTTPNTAAVHRPPVPNVHASWRDPGRIFTVSELEERLHRTSRALVDITKQIQRGEETYYEESQVLSAGCNIFRGWDLLIDARLTEVTVNPSNGLDAIGAAGAGG